MQQADNIISNCISELQFTTSRSGGSGGQHVNKVETKVTLRWKVNKSPYLTDKEKDLILEKLNNYINQDDELVLYHQTDRSQLKNKAHVIKKWENLIKLACKIKKARKPTKPSKRAIEKRKKDKSKRSLLKVSRQKPSLE